ncbi:CotH kinase family protein [Winogradskyella undariae]|uniref:CotH kinase family protein n=1 Tax=Winogradskyella undariae TaxID=1285465 RepID=UPI00156A7C8B|nr:CotH kinase family protein [Winogradskyella undariae]NRR90520.1 CotH kinase family protein [Winogradskyella undariae]
MKKTITLLTILFLTINLFSQELYDINTIQTIEIEFAESNWDALLDAEKAGDNNYTEATSVTINGTVFNQVGVKYKGNSSYSSSQVKNPFHIELDTYVDQDYQGYTDIKLANGFADPSFVRETVAYNIVNQYMDAPQANYANVYVNGTLIGLYTNTEAISKKFVNKHFNSNDNAFFSCSPPDGAGPTTTTLPNLEYLGTSYTSYDDAYEIKSDDDDDESVALAHWDNLIELTNILSNDIDNIENVLDVDSAIWMLAFDNVMVNLDSYIGQFKQNYYLYKDNNGQFKPVVWDLNMSFGTFAMTGETSTSGPGGPGGPGSSTGTLSSTTEKAELDHLLHDDDDSNFPLISKLLAIPKYKRMYLAHYKTILTENISNSNYLTLANDYQAIVTEAVTADTNKFYTDAQFTGNINTDYSVDGNTACGLTNLMSARSSYLLSQSDFTNTQPTISAVETSNETPIIGDTVTITANVTDENTVYIGYRTDETLPFTKLEMYDDGAHNDGTSGDGVFGLDIVVETANLQYYIYAENSNIGAFSPARAEYEFYSIEGTYTTIAVGDLVINEIMASNETTAVDQDGEYDDWLELYNNSSETLSLDNLYLSDDSDELLTWAFPSGLTIEPDSYLIVWCDKDDDQEGLHADVKFSSGGESAILSYDDGTIIENIIFGEQTDDMGYARVPNGTGDFVIQEPTFGENNESLSVDEVLFNNGLKVYPNPTSNYLEIQNSNYTIESVAVYNLQGQQLYNNSYANENTISLDFSSFSKGLYMVVVNKIAVIKIARN